MDGWTVCSRQITAHVPAAMDTWEPLSKRVHAALCWSCHRDNCLWTQMGWNATVWTLNEGLFGWHFFRFYSHQQIAVANETNAVLDRNPENIEKYMPADSDTTVQCVIHVTAVTHSSCWHFFKPYRAPQWSRSLLCSVSPLLCCSMIHKTKAVLSSTKYSNNILMSGYLIHCIKKIIFIL